MSDIWNSPHAACACPVNPNAAPAAIAAEISNFFHRIPLLELIFNVTNPEMS